jgi:hypothetical protein
MSAARARQAGTGQRDSADRTEPALAAEPFEKLSATEATEAIRTGPRRAGARVSGTDRMP